MNLKDEIDYLCDVYCLEQTDNLRSFIDRLGRMQYNRGRNHATCQECTYAQEEFMKGDKTADEIDGKLEECKSCDKLKYLQDIF